MVTFNFFRWHVRQAFFVLLRLGSDRIAPVMMEIETSGSIPMSGVDAFKGSTSLSFARVDVGRRWVSAISAIRYGLLILKLFKILSLPANFPNEERPFSEGSLKQKALYDRQALRISEPPQDGKVASDGTP